MTRAKSRISAAWDEERVDLRIELHLLGEKGIYSGPEHLTVSTRIKELDRLIREDLGYRTARG